MTEEEWLECTDPIPMLTFLRGKVSDRKLRLFAVSCWVAIEDYLSDFDRSYIRQAISSDGYLARDANPVNLERGRRILRSERQCSILTRVDDAAWVAFASAERCQVVLKKATRVWDEEIRKEARFQSRLVRDQFGLPMRSVGLDPGWLSLPVRVMANTFYLTRDFSSMPILADALQEAGCDNADVLDHCRKRGPHCRGCWVVDLILGFS